MSDKRWVEFPVLDRYIKATKLIRYLDKEFGKGHYQISTQSDIYIIKTEQKLSEDQIKGISALSARYSARSSSNRITRRTPAPRPAPADKAAGTSVRPSSPAVITPPTISEEVGTSSGGDAKGKGAPKDGWGLIFNMLRITNLFGARNNKS